MNATLLICLLIKFIRLGYWRATFESVMDDTMIYYMYNIIILPFHSFVCGIVLCWCVLPDMTSPYMTGYTIDSTVDTWPQMLFTYPHACVFRARVVVSITVRHPLIKYH